MGIGAAGVKQGISGARPGIGKPAVGANLEVGSALRSCSALTPA